jgi:hypothetical protein
MFRSPMSAFGASADSGASGSTSRAGCVDREKKAMNR